MASIERPRLADPQFGVALRGGGLGGVAIDAGLEFGELGPQRIQPRGQGLDPELGHDAFAFGGGAAVAGAVEQLKFFAPAGQFGRGHPHPVGVPVPGRLRFTLHGGGHGHPAFTFDRLVPVGLGGGKRGGGRGHPGLRHPQVGRGPPQGQFGVFTHQFGDHLAGVSTDWPSRTSTRATTPSASAVTAVGNGSGSIQPGA